MYGFTHASMAPAVAPANLEDFEILSQSICIMAYLQRVYRFLLLKNHSSVLCCRRRCGGGEERLEKTRSGGVGKKRLGGSELNRTLLSFFRVFSPF